MSDDVSVLEPSGAVVLATKDPRNASKEAIRAYLAQQDSPRSRSNILEALRRIARLAGVQDGPEAIQWCSFDYRIANQMRSTLAEAVAIGTYGVSTANLTLTHFRGLMACAARLGLVGPSQAMLASSRILKNIRGHTETRGRELSPSEETALRTAAVNFLPKYSGRMVDAAITLAIGAGLRRDEVAGLTMACLRKGELVIIGKGHKERRPPVDEEMRAALSSWLAIRSDLDPPHPALFCSPQRPNFPMSGWSFWWGVRQAAHAAFGGGEACGKGCKCLELLTGPHDFRRTYAGRLLDLGFGLSEVQKLMGHSNIAMTAKYDKRSMELLIEKRRKAKVLA